MKVLSAFLLVLSGSAIEAVPHKFGNSCYLDGLLKIVDYSSNCAASTASGNNYNCVANCINGLSCAGGGVGNLWTGDVVVGASHTLFHVARYSGNTRKRIITTNGGRNWLSGHWEARSGVKHTDNGWLTSSGQASGIGRDAWIISSDQPSLYHANGKDLKIAGRTGQPPNKVLAINQFGGEKSDWQLAEVIYFSRLLNANEIDCVEHYLGAKYNIPLIGSTWTPMPTTTIPATTATPYCDTLNVDYFLTKCSTEYPGQTSRLATVESDLATLKNSLKAKSSETVPLVDLWGFMKVHANSVLMLALVAMSMMVMANLVCLSCLWRKSNGQYGKLAQYTSGSAAESELERL